MYSISMVTEKACSTITKREQDKRWVDAGGLELMPVPNQSTICVGSVIAILNVLSYTPAEPSPSPTEVGQFN